ncbi:MAG: DsrE family protein [Gammaproteobacteria bacterium]|nr:DsrE family protein [Gammaproteobacteria bacterium]
MSIVTIIIKAAPYQGDNNTWHALRFAGASLAEDMEVQVHLLDKGVEVGRSGHQVAEGDTNLEELLSELIECGLEVRACGMALDDYGIAEGELIAGIEKGSMKSLAAWVKESDNVLTF